MKGNKNSLIWMYPCLYKLYMIVNIIKKIAENRVGGWDEETLMLDEDAVLEDQESRIEGDKKLRKSGGENWKDSDCIKGSYLVVSVSSLSTFCTNQINRYGFCGNLLIIMVAQSFKLGDSSK